MFTSPPSSTVPWPARMSFRFSERENPALFALTLENLLETAPVTFKTLTEEVA